MKFSNGRPNENLESRTCDPRGPERWPSPGAQASGPQDPRLGLRKFSLSPPWKGSFSMEELYKSTIENDPFHGGLNGNSWSLARARTVALVSTFREISARRPDSRPSRALAPALPAGASRPATDDVPRTGTSDRGRRLRTWESGPGAEASGPQDPRVGPGTFSASARRPVPRPGPSTKYRADGVDLGLTWELPSAGPAGA